MDPKEIIKEWLVANDASKLIGSIPVGFTHNCHTFSKILHVHRTALAQALSSIIATLDQGHAETISKISKAIVSVYCIDSIPTMMDILSTFIKEEVEQVKEHSGTLFRANCFATQVITAFSKEIGGTYLANTLSPVILATMLESCHGIDYEVDPVKCGGTEATLLTNIENLKRLIGLFLNAILNSKCTIPTVFRQICIMLRETTAKYFPESKYTVIGGFFFLRYICPAIITPDDLFYINDENPIITDQVRRGLVLVCKILQTAANNTTIKEPFMIPFKSTTSNIKPILQTFFDDITVIPDIEVPVYFHEVNNMYEKNLETIRQFIISNIGKFASHVIKSSEINWELLKDLTNIEKITLYNPKELKNKPIHKPQDTKAKLYNNSTLLLNPVSKKNNTNQPTNTRKGRHRSALPSGGHTRLLNSNTKGNAIKIPKRMKRLSRKNKNPFIEKEDCDNTNGEKVIKDQIIEKKPKETNDQQEEIEIEKKLPTMSNFSPASLAAAREKRRLRDMKSRSVGRSIGDKYRYNTNIEEKLV